MNPNASCDESSWCNFSHTGRSFADLAPDIVRVRLVVEGIPEKRITDKDIESYFVALSKQIEMIPLNAPVTHRLEGVGWAGWMHWSTSGCHMYTWERNGDSDFFSVDIYTCKAFSFEAAVEFTRDFFRCTKLQFRSV